MQFCNEATTDASIRVDGVTRCDECESKQRAPQHAAAVGNQPNIGGDEEPMAINMLLCFVQCHTNRTVKTNIIDCVSRYFSLDDALQAKDLLCDMYGSHVTYKVKTRRNTVNKMKADSIVEDIVNVMVELDQKRNHSNFVVNNILIVPHFDPKDMDPYAQLQRLVLLEERMRALEESQHANKIELIIQVDSLRKMKQSVDTHETIITSGALPKPPSYADMVGSRCNEGNLIVRLELAIATVLVLKVMRESLVHRMVVYMPRGGRLRSNQSSLQGIILGHCKWISHNHW